jgi:glycosyltransferase involved in cell wall biosynthesis
VPSVSNALYWVSGVRRDALRAGESFDPDAVICNDWDTLPIGAAIKHRRNVRLVYDSHEFASVQHSQNWKWRLFCQRHVQTIEQQYIGDADLAITVSQGIAEALHKLYALRRFPTVIRNVPSYQAVTYRPGGVPLTLLFHGFIRHERGLEELIDSMPLWCFPGKLVIRGYGLPDYINALRRRSEVRGVANAVSFEPGVAPEQLVKLASTADIGCLLLPGTTHQYEFALPNKLFEYLMAGLAVLATPRREMASILAETGAGRLTNLDAHSIAQSLNLLTHEAINGMKSNAIEAAKSLNWEHEKSVFVSAVCDI